MIQTPNFLYVEDDMNSRMVLNVLISRVMGYESLTIFEDSEDFETRVRALDPKPNIIFLDIQITPLDGYEMLQVLRSIPDYQDATIVAMTANVMSHDVEQLKQVGFDSLIGKPIVKNMFPQLIERIVSGEDVWFIP